MPWRTSRPLPNETTAPRRSRPSPWRLGGSTTRSSRSSRANIHTASTVNAGMRLPPRGWPSGSAGTLSPFAANRLSRGAGCNGLTACSKDSTPCRNTAGSPSAKANSLSFLRTTLRPRGASPSEHGRSGPRWRYRTSSSRPSGWRVSRLQVRETSLTGSACWTRPRRRPWPARCQSCGQPDVPAVT
jgi:hypothetical protein